MTKITLIVLVQKKKLLIKHCLKNQFYPAKNAKYDRYQCGLASIVYEVLDKTSSLSS